MKKQQKKSKKKRYPRSYARRITWRVVLALFVTMSVTTFLIAVISWASLSMTSAMRYEEALNSTNQEVQRALSDVYVASVNNAADIENHLDRPDQLPALMKRIVRLNPQIRSCGISFVEGYYPQKGRHFAPCARRRTDSTIVVVRNNADYLSQPWFTEALDSTAGFWGRPFFDNNDPDMALVAYLLPIRDRSGRTVAVMGADLSLDWLNAVMAEADRRTNWRESDNVFSSHSFIIDRDGTYIVHPERQRVLRKNYFDYARQTPDTLDDHVGRLMAQGQRGIFETDADGNELVLDGQRVYLFYAPVNYVGWTMAKAVPVGGISLMGYAVAALCVFLMVVALLVVFIVCWFSIRRVVKPLKHLALTAGDVAKGHFDTPLPAIATRDEIHLLRDSFEQMQRSLTQYVEQLKESTAQKASMESELKIAYDIQMQMLPKQFPPFPDRSDIDVFGSLTPAKGVGGDLFDFFLRDERLFFCIGDVSGKGVPAALVMAMSCSLFRSITRHRSKPDAIVMALNDALAAQNDTNMFVTLFVGVLDLATGRLRYCNAGHTSPLIITADGIATLPCDPNLPAGVMADWRFTEQETTVEHESTIFLYTDGLSEAEDNAQAQFGDDRIEAVARTLQTNHELQPQAVVERMTKAVHQFVGTAEQSDDLTMMAIRVKS